MLKRDIILFCLILVCIFIILLGSRIFQSLFNTDVLSAYC